LTRPGATAPSTAASTPGPTTSMVISRRMSSYAPPNSATWTYTNSASTNRLTSRARSRRHRELLVRCRRNTTSMGTFDAETRSPRLHRRHPLRRNSRRFRKLVAAPRSTSLQRDRQAAGRGQLDSGAHEELHLLQRPGAWNTRRTGFRPTALQEHQGSTRAVVRVSPVFPWGQTWEVSEVYEYNPYGDVVGYSWTLRITWSRKKFTGQRKDAETGLDYFGSRYYAGGQTGRAWNAKVDFGGFSNSPPYDRVPEQVHVFTADPPTA